MYDEEKDAYIPTYIPDDTEEAHIEGEFLVGNESGRKFPINEKGQVAILYDPYTNEETFEQRKKRQFNMTQEEIDKRIQQDKEINEKNLEVAIDKIYEKHGDQLRQIEQKKSVLQDIEKKLETNEPLTNEDLANAKAIASGNMLPNRNGQKQAESNIFAVHK